MNSRVALLAVLATALLTTSAAASASSPPVARSSAVCSDYRTQADAQRAGDTRDADGDGIYCESLPCPCLRPGERGSGGGKPKPKPRATVRRGRVASVTDGDTIKVRTGGRVLTVRLIGVDTPEVHGRLECGGREASAHMRRIARVGLAVTLRSDPTQAANDRYGRMLAYVDTPRGSLQLRMLRAGWASVYVVGKPFQRVASFRRAGARAKREQRGVWGLCGGNFHQRVGAQASSRPIRECGNYGWVSSRGRTGWTYGTIDGAGIFNVTSRVVNCRTARRVTLGSIRTAGPDPGPWHWRAWRCRTLVERHEYADIRCTAHHGRVVRYQTAA